MPQDTAQTPPQPFGIGERNLHTGPLARWRPWLILVFLGLPLLAALLGFLGGGSDATVRARSTQADMAVVTPGILRSGNWFETRVEVTPRADFADLTIEIEQPLWRGMSIDTVIPDADKVAATGGGFAYSFGEVKAGERFVMKVDGQIQPRGLRRLEGAVTLRDGERAIATVPLSILVLP